MSRTTSLLAWPLLVIAIAAWGAVLYEGSALLTRAQEVGAEASTADQQAEKVAYASRLHALAEETEGERRMLESVVNTDIVSIAKLIEETGKSAGVSATVSSANPIGGAKDIPGGKPLHAIEFFVQLQGSYTAIMHAASLFESMPLPSTIESMELQRLTQESTKPWSMTLRIRVFSTSDITT